MSRTIIPSILGDGFVLAVEVQELQGPFLGGSPETVAVYTRVFSLVPYDEAFLPDGSYRTEVP